MSDHDLALTLRQIVEFADEIAALVANRARRDLDINREFRRALEVLALSHDSQKKAVQLHFAGEGKRKVQVGSELTSDQPKTTYDVAQATSDGSVTLNGHASGYTVIVFSQPAIRAHIKGRSPSSARSFLQGLPNVVDVTLRQDPIALPWLPFFSSHITIRIEEVSGTGSA